MENKSSHGFIPQILITQVAQETLSYKLILELFQTVKILGNLAEASVNIREHHFHLRPGVIPSNPFLRKIHGSQ